jgi:hypothetical protein
LSIAAAFIVATGAFCALAVLAFLLRPVADLFALTGDRFFLPAVFARGFLAALRLLLEGFTRFFEALFCRFEALPRRFFFFVAILTCPLCVRRA